MASLNGRPCSGGVEYVEPGGVDSASIISTGGQQTVSSGGAAYYDAVSGGVQFDYGLSESTSVSGGVGYVEPGGVDSASMISDGGRQTVSKGGAAYDDEGSRQAERRLTMA